NRFRLRARARSGQSRPGGAVRCAGSDRDLSRCRRAGGACAITRAPAGKVPPRRRTHRGDASRFFHFSPGRGRLTALAAGFDDPAFAAEATFRRIRDASAGPGSIHELPVTVAPPSPLSPGAAAVALTLFDQDTPIWLDGSLIIRPVTDWLRF